MRDVFMLVADFLVMVFTLFFLQRRPALARIAVRADPARGFHKDKILVRLDQTIRAVVKGIVLTAVAQGLLPGGLCRVAGVPFPMVLMALTIPVGSIAVRRYGVDLGAGGRLPAVVRDGGQGLSDDVGLGHWGGIDHRSDSEAAVHRPGAQIPVLLLTFSVLGGLAAYGILGLFRADSRRIVPPPRCRFTATNTNRSLPRRSSGPDIVGRPFLSREEW